MSEQNNTQVIGADVKRLPFKDLVKRIGPGLIATGIVIGPGAVTTAAMLGSNYGYSLLWLVWPIIFMGMTFMMVTNRLAIVTGMPTIHAIRKYYGPVASGIVSIATFLACLFFTMGNISGTGAGFQRLVGFRHTGRHRVQCLLRDKIRNRSQVNFDHSDSSRCSRPYRGGFHLLGSCLYFTTRCTKWEVLKPTV